MIEGTRQLTPSQINPVSLLCLVIIWKFGPLPASQKQHINSSSFDMIIIFGSI